MPAMYEVVLPDAFFAGSTYGPDAPMKLSAEDRAEIQEAVCRFEWYFDSRRLDKLADLLTDDVVIDHIPGYGYHSGKKAAMDLLRGVVASVGIRHQATNPVIFFNDAGEPSVLSYLLVTQVQDETGKEDPPRILGHAVVTDTVRREGERWRIAKRTFEQMCLPKSYLPDAAARRAVGETAAQRAAERAAQPAPQC